MLTIDHIEIDTSDFGKALENYMNFSKKSADEVLRQQCKLVIQDVVRITPPNRGRFRKKAGEMTILADLSKTGRVVRGLRPLDRQDYEKHHRSQRGRKGRVGRRAVSIPVTPAQYNLLKRKLLSRVGLLAAGWLGAARALGLTFPSWITRHRVRGGGVIRRTAGFSIFYVVKNDSVYGGDRFAATRRLRWAVGKRTYSLIRSFENYLEKNKRKAGFI